MVLASNEEVIKEWEYGSVRTGNVVTQSTLTVTNKRIVKTERNARRIDQQEIPLSSVKSIHCTHDVPSKLGAILAIIFGVLIIVAAAVLLGKRTLPAIAAGPIFLAGLVFIVVGIRLLNQGAFSLEISTIGLEGDPLNAGFVKWFKKPGKGGKVKIKINNYVIDDLIENLGAIITEYRN